MNKIIIVGISGSGKSTLAKHLSKKLNFKYIELDSLYWKSGWTETPDCEFSSKITEQIKHPNWVIDGNYFKKTQSCWHEADTVVWIDLPFFRTLRQCFYRTFKRSLLKEKLWGTDNTESFFRMFSKDSIILWVLQKYYPYKKLLSQRIDSGEFQHLNFYRLKSKNEVEKFLSKIEFS